MGTKADFTTSICSSSESISGSASDTDCSSDVLVLLLLVLCVCVGGEDDEGRDEAGLTCTGLMCSVEPRELPIDALCRLWLGTRRPAPAKLYG